MDAVPAQPQMASAKTQFLEAYEREHAITVKVLRAYPQDQLDLRPSPKSRTARELGWIFVMERGLGMAVFNDQFAELAKTQPPPMPESWDEILGALEAAHRDFANLIRATPDERMLDTVEFLTGPNQTGRYTRLEWVWFLLHDEIHHRGQFSIYLRMAGAHVPSIYGPTADEPWM